MKASLFSPVNYIGPGGGAWPVPHTHYSNEIAQASMQTAMDQFGLADELGFDWVTLAEHHFAPFSLTPNPMVMAGALTQTIKRAKIALLGADIPILNPVRVAEEFAMLDTMTGGRIVAGMLRGTPNEYVTYNINPNESRARFEEALQIIKTCWTEPTPFGWQGRHYEYRAISIWPRPVQNPHPPIYMSGSSPEAGDFAARHRISLGFAVTTTDHASVAAKYYRAKANEYGWTPEPDDVLYRLSFHVAESDDQALADLEERPQPSRQDISRSNTALESAVAQSSYFGRAAAEQQARRSVRGGTMADRVARGQILIGSPDTVFGQIQALQQRLGCGILDLVPAAQLGDATEKSIELFGRRVLPRMHQL